MLKILIKEINTRKSIRSIFNIDFSFLLLIPQFFIRDLQWFLTKFIYVLFKQFKNSLTVFFN